MNEPNERSHQDEVKLFYPDCLFDIGDISLSTFLYFDEQISITLHPTVSIFNTGCDPFRFAETVDLKSPAWKGKFLSIFETWRRSSEAIHGTLNLLQPLRGKYLKSIWMAYSRTEEAFKENLDLAKSTNLPKDTLIEMINIPMAAQELIAHILFEKFLEIYHAEIEKEKLQVNADALKTRLAVDYTLLYQYCDGLFTNTNFEDLLIGSYFYRLKILKHFPDILLSNERLVDFLNAIPIHKKALEETESDYYNNLDIISWEIFRQLTSPYMESLPKNDRVPLISSLKGENRDEIVALRHKCVQLAEQYKGERELGKLQNNIAQHVRIHTEKEIGDLLRLDRQQYTAVMDAIFSDEKTWLALGAFLTAILTGGPLFTAGTAFATVAQMGAKTYKSIAKNENKKRDSDYALIYRMSRY